MLKSIIQHPLPSSDLAFYECISRLLSWNRWLCRWWPNGTARRACGWAWPAPAQCRWHSGCSINVIAQGNCTWTRTPSSWRWSGEVKWIPSNTAFYFRAHTSPRSSVCSKEARLSAPGQKLQPLALLVQIARHPIWKSWRDRNILRCQQTALAIQNP